MKLFDRITAEAPRDDVDAALKLARPGGQRVVGSRPGCRLNLESVVVAGRGARTQITGTLEQGKKEKQQLQAERRQKRF